jgi:hypothetical protein
MCAQAFGRVDISGQCGFAKAGVDFAVTDVVHQGGWPALAAFPFWDQVVQALRCIAGDWSRGLDGYRAGKRGPASLFLPCAHQSVHDI